MNRVEFARFTRDIDDKLGNLRMIWEGPQPHDFRNMKERGVRFVHSELFAKLPKWPDVEYAPDQKVEFRIAVGDDEAAVEITKLIASAGYAPVYKPGPDYGVVTFEVHSEERVR